jgi:glucosamine--fructose-6-phosphate aminotransferase (isomerizing)
MAISQSGASPDLLATLQGARDSGARVIALTNSPDSEMAAMADLHISLSAGPELSVAATKTYTAELISIFACVRLAGGWSVAEVEASISLLSDCAAELLESSRTAVTSVVAELHDAERVVVIGRGLSMSSAKESALKLMETCRLAASGWSAADAKHGPIGQIVDGTPVILFTSSEIASESVLALRPLLTSLGAKLYTVGGIRHDERSERLIADLRLEAIDDALLPVLEILPIQLIALELSLARGLNPDSPAGLLKVTVTT